MTAVEPKETDGDRAATRKIIIGSGSGSNH